MAKTLKQLWQNRKFFLPIQPTSEPVTLTQNRIYILPTRSGLGFMLLTTLLLLIAFVYNNNLAYMLCFLLASVFFITILHTFKMLSGLVISKGQTSAAFAGEPVSFDIQVQNPSHVTRFQLTFNLTENCYIDLLPLQKQTVTLYSPTEKRGWHPCGTISVACTYPLGLFRAWAILRFDSKALVYPKPSENTIPFPETTGVETQQGTTRKGNDDFYGLREYQDGDSIRQIHWKALAKGLGVMSKQYSGETLAELWLTYDASPGYDTEQRLSQLCRWLIDADKAGLQYGFRLPHQRIEPSSGTLHFKKCLEALALF